MGLLPRTMIQCLLWCYVIAFYLSRAKEVKRERLSHCYVSLDDHVGEIYNPTEGRGITDCEAFVEFYATTQKITFYAFIYTQPEPYHPENPLHCRLVQSEGEKKLYPKDEEEFSQYDGKIRASCSCNQSAICATQPETFESYLNTQRSNLPFYAKKAAEIISKFLRKGLLPNNAIEAMEEFRAASSTPTSTTKATTTEPSTTAETTTTTETPTTATSTTSTETSTTFATTSDYEHSDTSTTSAYEDSSTATDMALFTTRETEVTVVQQMDPFLGQYGLVIAVGFGIVLILAIVIIAYMIRKGKGNEDLEGAIGKRGTNKSKESKGTTKERTSKSKEFGEASKGGTSKSKEFGETLKEGSKESITSKTKESGSKEKKSGSKE